MQHVSEAAMPGSCCDLPPLCNAAPFHSAVAGTGPVACRPAVSMGGGRGISFIPSGAYCPPQGGMAAAWPSLAPSPHASYPHCSQTPAPRGPFSHGATSPAPPPLQLQARRQWEGLGEPGLTHSSRLRCEASAAGLLGDTVQTAADHHQVLTSGGRARGLLGSQIRPLLPTLAP